MCQENALVEALEEIEAQKVIIEGMLEMIVQEKAKVDSVIELLIIRGVTTKDEIETIIQDREQENYAALLMPPDEDDTPF